MVFCQGVLLWNNTKCPQKCLCKPHRPVEDMIILPLQPEFSNSRAAPASVTRGNTYRAKNQWSQASSPSSSTPHHTLDPSAEDNLLRAPYLPHRGRSHPQTTGWPPASAWTPANSLPSPALGLVFLSMQSFLSLCYKLFQGFATDRQTDRQVGLQGHRNGLQQAQSLWVYIIRRTMLTYPLKQHR